MLEEPAPDLPVPIPRSYWVIPGRFLAGEYPGAKDPTEALHKIESLVSVGIRHFISLMEPDETDHANQPFESYEKIINDFAGERGNFNLLRFIHWK